MRDWADEQDAWDAEQRRAHMATVGDVERIALEIAGDNDDRVLRLVAALDGRLREVESDADARILVLEERVDRLWREQYAVARDAIEAQDRVATLESRVAERASEIATENDDAAHRGIDALRADFEAMAERLLRAEAALVDAHRRLDVTAKRRAGDERDTRLLVERVASLERRLADIEERQDGGGDGGRLAETEDRVGRLAVQHAGLDQRLAEVEARQDGGRS